MEGKGEGQTRRIKSWREPSAAEAGNRGRTAGGELGAWKEKETTRKGTENKNGESSAAEANRKGRMAGGALGVWKEKGNDEKEGKTGEGPLLPKQATEDVWRAGNWEFGRERRTTRKTETNWRESSVAEAGSRGRMAGGELGVWKEKENDKQE